MRSAWVVNLHSFSFFEEVGLTSLFGRGMSLELLSRLAWV